MPNTNGMRFPMTALRDFSFLGADIQKNQVFDAVGKVDYERLAGSGDAAKGDLHNASHEVSNLSLQPNANGRSPADVVVPAGKDEGQARTATGGVIASPDAPTNAGAGGSLGSVTPAIPELQKANPIVQEPSVKEEGSDIASTTSAPAPGADLSQQGAADQTEGDASKKGDRDDVTEGDKARKAAGDSATSNESAPVKNEVKDEATDKERAAASGDATTSTVSAGTPAASNAKVTKSDEKTESSAKVVRRSHT